MPVPATHDSPAWERAAESVAYGLLGLAPPILAVRIFFSDLSNGYGYALLPAVSVGFVSCVVALLNIWRGTAQKAMEAARWATSLVVATSVFALGITVGPVATKSQVDSDGANTLSVILIVGAVVCQAISWLLKDRIRHYQQTVTRAMIHDEANAVVSAALAPAVSDLQLRILQLQSQVDDFGRTLELVQASPPRSTATHQRRWWRSLWAKLRRRPGPAATIPYPRDRPPKP